MYMQTEHTQKTIKYHFFQHAIGSDIFNRETNPIAIYGTLIFNSNNKNNNSNNEKYRININRNITHKKGNFNSHREIL